MHIARKTNRSPFCSKHCCAISVGCDVVDRSGIGSPFAQEQHVRPTAFKTTQRRWVEYGRKTRGLTILRTVLAIAAVTLLIAIVLPALNQARRDAKRARCVDNLRQLHQGWQVYLGENQQTFPSEINDHANFYRKGLLARSMTPPQAFRCPADVGEAPGPSGTGSSYVMSLWLVGDRAISQGDDWERELQARLWEVPRPVSGHVQRPKRIRPLRVAQTTAAPSELVFGGDYTWLHTINSPPYDEAPPLLQSRLDAVNYHGDYNWSNTLFLDGSTWYQRFGSRIFVSKSLVVSPFADLNRIACEFGHCSK